MKPFIKSVLAAVVLALPITAPAEQLSKEKSADIHNLLVVTGAFNIGKQFSELAVAQIFEAVRQMRPDIPQEMIDIIGQEVRATVDANLDDLEALVIPLYHKHFTHAEIRGLLDFYATDLGKKTIKVLPGLVGESMLIGQEWGKSLGPEIEQRVIQRLKTEGYDLSA